MEEESEVRVLAEMSAYVIKRVEHLPGISNLILWHRARRRALELAKEREQMAAKLEAALTSNQVDSNQGEAAPNKEGGRGVPPGSRGSAKVVPGTASSLRQEGSTKKKKKKTARFQEAT